MVETTPADDGTASVTDALDEAIANNPDDPRLETTTVEGPCHCVKANKPHPEWDKHHPEACGEGAYAATVASGTIDACASNPLYDGQYEEVIAPGE